MQSLVHKTDTGFTAIRKEDERMITDCDQCPCLNIDYESGGSCNLGYHLALYNVSGPGMHYGSDNCALDVVRFADGEFKPTWKIISNK